MTTWTDHEVLTSSRESQDWKRCSEEKKKKRRKGVSRKKRRQNKNKIMGNLNINQTPDASVGPVTRRRAERVEGGSGGRGGGGGGGEGVWGGEGGWHFTVGPMRSTLSSTTQIPPCFEPQLLRRGTCTVTRSHITQWLEVSTPGGLSAFTSTRRL